MEQIEKVRAELAERMFIVPWSTEDPLGPDRLRRLAAPDKMTAEAGKPAE